MTRSLTIFCLLIVVAYAAASCVAPPPEPVPPAQAPAPTSKPPTGSPAPTDSPVPPTDAPVPPTDAPVPPTDTPVPPTDIPVPPADTPVTPTNTPAPQSSEPPLAGLDGETLLAERCTGCHSLGRVETARKSEAEWQSTVLRMVVKGAELTQDEQAAVVAFLVGPADEQTLADVLFVRAQLQSNGLWSFDVTVQHNDTGWDHYADRWEVLAPNGEVLATRVLAHPHVDEQPFTRSQSGIPIPPNISEVRVRAHDLVDGYGGSEVVVVLNSDGGPVFEVLR